MGVDNNLKRSEIFKRYSHQWELLKQNNLLIGIPQKYVGNYICPICLGHFSPGDLDQKNRSNPLTLEHTPPENVGGKANILTCRSCNNAAGTQLENHLKIRLDEMANKRFLPNVETPVKIKKDTETYQGIMTVDENGSMSITHTISKNHPVKLNDFIKSLDPDSKNPQIILEFPDLNIDLDKVEYTILKAAYLLLFEKFGYIFILDPIYNKLREQILNPEKRIYPKGTWLQPPLDENACGVYYTMNEGVESFLVIFVIKIKLLKRIIAVHLPMPFNSIDTFKSNLEFLKHNKYNPQGKELDNFPFPASIDFLTNEKCMKHLSKCISSKETYKDLPNFPL
ncbi:MAG TPA: hypothetical protein VK590_01250 [Saprospiraceae bacterium]|nr:hypothetical protein [Saprospiraceae bacterium]